MTDAAPWSYSRIHAFEQCPKQFYYEKVLKAYPQKETDAMRYGTDFHEAAELYVGEETPLPDRFLFAKDALDKLLQIEGDAIPEQKMGLTEELEPCDFYADDVWWRGIADLTIVDSYAGLAHSVDYKTGKNARYADKGQLELMAIATFAYYPEVETIKGALFYVISGHLIKAVYCRDDLDELINKWDGKFERMEEAFENDVWNAKQSGLCKAHCPVLECQHNGRNS
jgi:RecB family exonuclease